MGIHNTIRSSATGSFATMRLACVILATAALLVSPVLGQTYSSVAEAASSTPDLSILLLAAQQAELAVIDPSEIGPGTLLLSDPDLVATVFAPSNAAFEAYLTANNLTTNELLASEDLASILQFHVVPDVAAQSSSLTNGQTVPTVLGPDLTISVDGSTVTVSGGTNTATVTTPDVAAGQAIVHIIDAVLIPPSAAPGPAPGPAPTTAE